MRCDEHSNSARLSCLRGRLDGGSLHVHVGQGMVRSFIDAIWGGWWCAHWAVDGSGRPPGCPAPKMEVLIRLAAKMAVQSMSFAKPQKKIPSQREMHGQRVGGDPCQRLTSGHEFSGTSHQGTASGYSSRFQPHQAGMYLLSSQEPLKVGGLGNRGVESLREPLKVVFLCLLTTLGDLSHNFAI